MRSEKREKREGERGEGVSKRIAGEAVGVTDKGVERRLGGTLEYNSEISVGVYL